MAGSRPLAQVRVVRDGREALISVMDVVVGDVMLIETGDILPADGLLFSAPTGDIR